MSDWRDNRLDPRFEGAAATPESPVIPPLRACPFCGRDGHAVPHHDVPKDRMLYSVGCFKDPTPRSTDPWFEDCLSPGTYWLPLKEAVAQWNKRARWG